MIASDETALHHLPKISDPVSGYIRVVNFNNPECVQVSETLKPGVGNRSVTDIQCFEARQSSDRAGGLVSDPGGVDAEVTQLA